MFITSKSCAFANTCHLYSFTSGKLFIGRKELEHIWFYSFCEAQQVGLTESYRKLRILFMCIPTFTLLLIRAQNTVVDSVKNGTWIQNPTTWSSLLLHSILRNLEVELKILLPLCILLLSVFHLLFLRIRKTMQMRMMTISVRLEQLSSCFYFISMLVYALFLV